MTSPVTPVPEDQAVGMGASDIAAGHARDDRDYVLNRYDEAIRYYWEASVLNRRLYKWTRYLLVVLGASVTLMASLSSSRLVTGLWQQWIAVATPFVAALLTIVGGLSQSFQWGAAWQELVLTAERLQRERDRITVTHSNSARDLEILNTLVLEESEGFFARIFGSVHPPPARDAADAA